jgi:hypothetical protein
MTDQQINLVDHTSNGDNTPTMAAQPEQRPTASDSHIDILYENQRGWFIFGIPLFSNKALWNLRIDPAPWQDAKFRPSAVNITNAQVPDPSWVWDWKSWYVDMSLDVDEEGWQYSLLFKGSAWHGNHPWFHSFVRRRRWLRRRVKQRLPPKTKENAKERMFGETFSIGTTLARSTTFGTGSGLLDSAQTSLDEEVRDIATLMRKLRKAAIDREKIIYIHKFIDDGGEELHYLAGQVCILYPHILNTTNMFRYRPSCRCLYSRIRVASSSPHSWTASKPPKTTANNTRKTPSPKAMPKNAESITCSRPSRQQMTSARSWSTGVTSRTLRRRARRVTRQIPVWAGMRRNGRVSMLVAPSIQRLEV